MHTDTDNIIDTFTFASFTKHSRLKQRSAMAKHCD